MTTRAQLNEARNTALEAYKRLKEAAGGTSAILTEKEAVEGFFIASTRWARAELAWHEASSGGKVVRG